MNIRNIFNPYLLKLNLSTFYYQYLSPFSNYHKVDSSRKDYLLKDFINELDKFERIIVVAGGPSSLNLKSNNDALYLAMNKSFTLVQNLPFIYFVTENHFLYNYLKCGFKSNNWMGTIFRFELSTLSSNSLKSLQYIIDYKKKYVRNKPEILCTDFIDKNKDYNKNFNDIEFFFNNIVGIKLKSFNTGFSAVSIAFFIAHTLNIPLEIYGMDFGVGGKVHFDNTEMKSLSVVGSRIKRKYTELYKKIKSQNKIEIHNHSYFKP